MFEPRIKISSDLYEKAKVEAERRGYSSVEEFVTHLLEQTVAGGDAKTLDDQNIIEEQLKGLGYLD